MVLVWRGTTEHRLYSHDAFVAVAPDNSIKKSIAIELYVSSQPDEAQEGTN